MDEERSATPTAAAIITTTKQTSADGLEMMDDCSHIDDSMKPYSLGAPQSHLGYPRRHRDDTPEFQQSGNNIHPRVPQEPVPSAAKDFSHMMVSASLDDKDAQVTLGDMYKDGQGIPQDYQAAMDCYLKAAAQGDATAQYNIGALYHNGQGVPQDFSQAMAWYRKASDQQYAAA
ncbi:hypothetical protein BGX33_008304 [Mortierella sp. NVP41]|nr:hypothetical protein BGX33_008304 [Mortierella sp. NVP41]